MLRGWEKNSLIVYLGQKMGNEWEKYNKISQNKTPGDSKVTSSLGFSSKNLLE